MEHGGSDPLHAALQALGRALQSADGPPPDLVRQAKLSFTWRTIDAELAALSFDSAVSGELAGVRGGDDTRTLTLETPSVVLDLEITSAADAFDLAGSLMPSDVTTLTYQRADDGETAVAVDDLGRFALAGLAAGPLRFVIQTSGGTRVVTDWFSV
jgi:hypothetical protein